MTKYDKTVKILLFSKGDLMKKKNKKNVLVYFSTLLVILSLFHNKHKKSEIEESINDETYEIYGTYNRGNIYICDSLSNVDKVYEVCDENDVVVVDQCNLNDPNMKIVSSYKITDKEEMNQILNVIKEYCYSKHSNFKRSINSMQNEWIVHNICSNFSIKRDHTDDVDLNNGDETLYKSKIIGKIIGN